MFVQFICVRKWKLLTNLVIIVINYLREMRRADEVVRLVKTKFPSFIQNLSRYYITFQNKWTIFYIFQ